MRRLNGRGFISAASCVARHVTLAGFVAATTMSAYAQVSTPVGVWQTVDDHTGQPKALVQIVEDSGDGSLSGKVIKGLGAHDQPARRCTACTDARKDQPIPGMTIIDGMHRTNNGWDGGHILDPETGKIYRCRMRIEDGGQKLVVRGYIGISLLGRSQTWNRQQ